MDAGANPFIDRRHRLDLPVHDDRQGLADIGGCKLIEDISAEVVEFEVHDRSTGDRVGGGRRAFKVDSVKTDLFLDDDEAGKLIDAIIIADVVPGGDFAGGEDLRLLQCPGFRIHFTGVGEIVLLQLGGEFVVDHLEEERALSTKERVHPLRIGGAGYFDENLVAALEPDHRLAHAELVDSFFQDLQILADSLSDLACRSGSAFLGDIRIHIRFQENTHSSAQIQAELKGLVSESLEFKKLIAVIRFDRIEHVLLVIEAGEQRGHRPFLRNGFAHRFIVLFRCALQEGIFAWQGCISILSDQILQRTKFAGRLTAGVFLDLHVRAGCKFFDLLWNKAVPLDCRKYEICRQGDDHEDDRQTIPFFHDYLQERLLFRFLFNFFSFYRIDFFCFDNGSFFRFLRLFSSSRRCIALSIDD